mmetsp:Transcript_1086/g.6998  ORF Transcript_1086/g.6998 Transcript_1086/m.6998 type:complete len:309 (+) Transcript_1086:88-1014(+)
MRLRGRHRPRSRWAIPSELPTYQVSARWNDAANEEAKRGEPTTSWNVPHTDRSLKRTECFASGTDRRLDPSAFERFRRLEEIQDRTVQSRRPKRSSNCRNASIESETSSAKSAGVRSFQVPSTRWESLDRGMQISTGGTRPSGEVSCPNKTTIPWTETPTNKYTRNAQRTYPPNRRHGATRRCTARGRRTLPIPRLPLPTPRRPYGARGSPSYEKNRSTSTDRPTPTHTLHRRPKDRCPTQTNEGSTYPLSLPVLFARPSAFPQCAPSQIGPRRTAPVPRTRDLAFCGCLRAAARPPEPTRSTHAQTP